jgi:hypothetical protein
MEDTKGRFAKLPDGQRVVIEEIENGLATVRRVDGEWEGKVAVCSISSLEMELPTSDSSAELELV